MSTTDEATTRDPEGTVRLAALCIELRDVLGSAMKSIDDEIRSYPKPIPRCDAQFNHLYEQRSRLSQLLARANAMSTLGIDPRELVETLVEFTSTERFTADAAEQALRECIDVELARRSPVSNANLDRRTLDRRR